MDQHELAIITQTRALSVTALDEVGIIASLMYHYNRYRGLKAFLLDINHQEIAYKGVSSFLVATSPDKLKGDNTDPVENLKAWILDTLTALNNPNITLVISCPASSLYRFADVIDKANPPLANIDFAPLHQFEEIVSDVKTRYDILMLGEAEETEELAPPDESPNQ